MSAPMHIAWLIWGDEPGGVAAAVLNNAAQLQALGQPVSIYSFGPGELVDAARRRGYAVHLLGDSAELHPRYVGFGFSPGGVLRRLRMLLSLRRVLAQGLGSSARPQVLCIPWPDLMPLAGPVCQSLGLALVLEMPNTPSRYPLQLNQRAYAWAVRRWRVQVLANSDYTAAHMALVPGVAVVTPAVDAARFDPAQVLPIPRAALGLPESAVVLGLIARLDPSKGADLLIAALAELNRPDLHLLLVGGPLDSDYAQRLRAQVGDAGLAEQVQWVDTVSDPEHYWAACNLAINARRDAEPFGLSIVEAMLMQRPVIAHALGQPASTIVEGETGWLYPQPDAPALAAALRRALAARAAWPAMGRAARAEALRRFASPDLAPRYLGLLRDHAAGLRA